MLRALVYSKGKLREEADLSRIARAASNRSNTVWLDVDSPDGREMESVAKAFGLHALSVEDVTKVYQRPKAEAFENYALVIIRSFRKDDPSQTVQLNFILSHNFLITLSFEPVTAQDDFYEKARQNPYLMSLGSDYLLYAVIDKVVDDYFPIAGDITEKLDVLEDAVFQNPDEGLLNGVFETKKRLFAFRKEVQPVRDIANALSRGEVKFVRGPNSPYFRDVYDHMVRILDNVELNRDLVSNIMDAYLSAVSNNLNKSMKRIAAISTILMPPTLLASAFGMNFRVIPEADWDYGFYLIIVVMVAMVLGSFWYFRKKDWI